MPVIGSFGGSRSFGKIGLIRPLPPTIGSVQDVGTNRPYDDGALSYTLTANPNTPTPDFYNSWAIAPDNSEISAGSSAGPTITIYNLKSDTAYRIKAVAVLRGIASDFAYYDIETTVTTVPQAPTIGTVTDVGTNRPINDAAASVSFTPRLSGGKSQTYKVYSSDGTETGSGSSSPLTATGIDLYLTNLHSFKVKAINANGESAFSSSASGTITSTPGGVSLIITSYSKTENTVTFDYSVPNTGGKAITSIRFYVMSGGVEMGTQTVTNSTSGSLTLSHTKLTENGFLWAVASNANGAGSDSTAGSTIEPDLTPVPPFFPPDFGYSPPSFSPFFPPTFGYSIDPRYLDEATKNWEAHLDEETGEGSDK
jgi:hypothetical protein